MVAHICEQLRWETPLILTYPQRQPTRYEHSERIKSYLGPRSFKQTDNDVVVGQVRERVRAGARLHELLADVEELLRERKIVLPGVTVFDSICGYNDDGIRELSGTVAEEILGACRTEFLRSPDRQSGLIRQGRNFTCTLLSTAR